MSLPAVKGRRACVSVLASSFVKVANPQMSIKKWALAALRQAGFDVRRISFPTEHDLEQVFVEGGSVPWSLGYLETRNRMIGDVIGNSGLLELFRRGVELPVGFGIGYDERCVEYPWLFANLREGAACVLDAGSAMNHRFLVEHPGIKNMKLHILTLFPENNCFWEQGISYMYDDLREIPIRGDYYDLIICLSTLEHVGFDNSIYGGNANQREHRPDDFVLVIKELRRVLKPGGSLFLSVPFGTHQDLGWSQQFDRELLTRAVDAFSRPCEVAETFYRYAPEGWQKSTAQDCADSKYVEWIARAWLHGQMPNPVPTEPDRAAAARAVACIKLIKGSY